MDSKTCCTGAFKVVETFSVAQPQRVSRTDDGAKMNDTHVHYKHPHDLLLLFPYVNQVAPHVRYSVYGRILLVVER